MESEDTGGREDAMECNKRTRLELEWHEDKQAPLTSTSLSEVVGSSIERQSSDLPTVKALKEQLSLAENETQKLRMRVVTVERMLEVERWKCALAESGRNGSEDKAEMERENAAKSLADLLDTANQELAEQTSARVACEKQLRSAEEESQRLAAEVLKIKHESKAKVDELTNKLRETLSWQEEEKQKTELSGQLLMKSLDMQTTKATVAKSLADTLNNELVGYRQEATSTNEWNAKEAAYKQRIEQLEKAAKDNQPKTSTSLNEQEQKSVVALTKSCDALKVQLAELQEEKARLMTMVKGRLKLEEELKMKEAELELANSVREELLAVQGKYDYLLQSQASESVAKLKDELEEMRQEKLHSIACLKEAQETATVESSRAAKLSNQWNAAVEEKVSLQRKLEETERALACQQRLAETLKAERDTLQSHVQDFAQTDIEESGAKEIVETLNTSLKQSQNQVESLLEELTKTRPAGEEEVSEQANEGERNAVADLTAAQAKVAEQEKMIERLEQEVGQLQQRVDTFSFDPTVTKILTPIESPLVIHLREELAMVKEALVETQQGKSSAVEIALLRKEIRKKEKALELFTEQFRQRYDQIRGCFLYLFGYRVDTSGESSIRLRSMYSARANDTLLFEVARNTVKLLDSPYYDTIGWPVRKLLEEKHSVPAFLSSLTLDLFSKQASKEE